MTTPHPRVILKKDVVNTRGISDFWAGLRKRAAEKKRRVLFPEAADARVLSAAGFLARAGICLPVLAGKTGDIRDAARRGDFSLDGVEILDADRDDKKETYAAQLHERRKSKGLDLDQARTLLEDPLYLAAMALKDGRAHGLVGGAVRTTADTVRAGFACLGLAPGASTVFGVFLMECPNAAGGPRRLAFADAAVSPQPSARALASVGLESARFFERFTGETPRVAYLSFSTRGSAEDESVLKMRQAAEALKQKAPGLAVDGELQGDAALIPDIAEQKGAGGSPVAGRANVLVFPDLNAGNAAYKLVQHLGGARAVGPALPGLSKPMSDLSRGCNDEDIVDAAALVSLMEAS